MDKRINDYLRIFNTSVEYIQTCKNKRQFGQEKLPKTTKLKEKKKKWTMSAYLQRAVGAGGGHSGRAHLGTVGRGCVVHQVQLHGCQRRHTTTPNAMIHTRGPSIAAGPIPAAAGATPTATAAAEPVP